MFWNGNYCLGEENELYLENGKGQSHQEQGQGQRNHDLVQSQENERTRNDIRLL